MNIDEHYRSRYIFIFECIYLNIWVKKYIYLQNCLKVIKETVTQQIIFPITIIESNGHSKISSVTYSLPLSVFDHVNICVVNMHVSDKWQLVTEDTFLRSIHHIPDVSIGVYACESVMVSSWKTSHSSLLTVI